MMLRWVYFSVLLVYSVSCATSGPGNKSAVQTLNSIQFEQVDSLLNHQVRPLAIFLHAPWCTFCRNMEQTTFKDERVIKRLNEHYYFITFDGEQTADVIFRGKQFKFIPSGRSQGTHELAIELGAKDGVMTYPTFLIIDEKGSISFKYHAFISREGMIAILDEAI